MNSRAPNGHADAPLPPYEAWPAAQNHAVGNNVEESLPTAMDVDSTTERSSRAPSTFSVDDYEVAKALTSLQEGWTIPCFS